MKDNSDKMSICNERCERARKLISELHNSKCLFDGNTDFIQCSCINCLAIWANLCTIHRNESWSKSNGFQLERRQIQSFVEKEIMNPLLEVLLE